MEIPKFKTNLDKAYDDNTVGVSYFRLILDKMDVITNKRIKYALWLYDSINDILNEYSCEEIDNDYTEFDLHLKSNVILADLGRGGRLYGYCRYPTPVMTVNRRNEKI